MISQVKNLAFEEIKVYGGFQKGLPLANPRQSGLLVQGFIYQLDVSKFGLPRDSLYEGRTWLALATPATSYSSP